MSHPKSKTEVFCVLVAISMVLAGVTFACTALAEKKVIEVSSEPVDVGPTAVDPTITEMVNKVSLGKLYTSIYDLQNFTNRDAKSIGAQNAASYIQTEFAKSASLGVRFDPFNLEGTPVKNVLAVLPGLNKSNPKQYIISGHYDSYSDNPTNKPGADDDATGAAVAIEAARVMSQYRFDATVIFAAWNAEEYGLVGSWNYAKNASAHNVAVGADLQFDMVGNDDNKGDSLYKIDVGTYTGEGWLWTAINDANSQYSCGLTLTSGGAGGGSDHASFHEFGYPAVMCIETDFSPYYHSANDIISNINPELVKRTAKMGVAALAGMAGTLTPAKGAIFLNEAAYQPNDTAEITVYDSDLSAGTIDTSIKSTTETTAEPVTLSLVEPGIYRGTIQLKWGIAVPGDGILQVHHGDFITAQYDDTAPVLTATVKARVDGMAPDAWGIAVIPGVNDATIKWYTDEDANSTVMYGKTPPLTTKSESLKMVTEHSIYLFGLDPATVYYFDLASTDLAGNRIFKDNSGAHFGFRTLTGTASIPGASFAYWVREGVDQNPNVDGTMWSGYGSKSLRIYGAAQFNLTSLPGSATILNATLMLYGQGWLNSEGSSDLWSVKMLTSAIDSNFPSHTWPNINGAVVDSGLPPVYPDSALGQKLWTYYYFNSPTLISKLNAHITTGKLSIRTEGRLSGSNHIYAWDAGRGEGSYGEQFGPRLTILYTTVGDNTGPVVSNIIILPNPTNGARFVDLSATITDDKSKVVAAEWFWGSTDPGFGKGYPASAKDGIFNSKVVNVSHRIDVGSFSVGDYTVNLRGMDESGNWGDTANVVLHVSAYVVMETVILVIPAIALFAVFISYGRRRER